MLCRLAFVRVAAMTSEADPREPEEGENNGPVASQAREMARLTPMMAQYLAIKAAIPRATPTLSQWPARIQKATPMPFLQ